ncbi:hypothetical protein HMPREF1983_00050 [Gemella bergeri ATCC 700627]|uniref:OsmC-like protein n=1 Tax=Gemella bergeri ATCC 700627 TaxID=1321820 RepID=U2S4K4_9BACL|nr:OsmC family protein [Gemella bergeri]ERK60628.1 hypothetical protein HMPREF1983_00050 [Gemella bergeri ATCC 700627]
MNSIYESHNYDISFRGVLSENKVLKLFTNNDCIEVSSEIDFDINADYKSSLNYFASATLGGIIHSIVNQSKHENFEIEEIEGKIHFILKNPLTLLGVKGYNEEPKIDTCKIIIYLYADIEDNELIEFCNNALKRSFIYNTLKSSIDINIEFIPIV